LEEVLERRTTTLVVGNALRVSVKALVTDPPLDAVRRRMDAGEATPPRGFFVDKAPRLATLESLMRLEVPSASLYSPARRVSCPAFLTCVSCQIGATERGSCRRYGDSKAVS
jgi:hypothetical protein